MKVVEETNFMREGVTEVVQVLQMETLQVATTSVQQYTSFWNSTTSNESCSSSYSSTSAGPASASGSTKPNVQ